MPQAGRPTVVRVAGADRVGTAVAVSRYAFAAADVAVVVRADTFADALAGGPLAAFVGGPLLLVPPGDAVPPAVLEEVDRLGVDEVVLLGGTSALSPAVEATFGERRSVTRIGGGSRYATAAQVAERIGLDRGVVVASGATFPDGLAAGALAAAQGRPVLLVEPDGIPPEVQRVLDDRRPPSVVVVGGTASVSDDVAGDLAARGAAVDRIRGRDRYETAAAVHAAAVAGGLVDPTVTWLASGVDHADALAVGPAAAARGAGVLLVDGGWLEATPAPARRLLAARGLREVVLAGGTFALEPDTEAQLDALLHGAQLPGGGRFAIPERRLVALYGSHFAPVLGVLGEQPPEEAAARAQPLVAPFVERSDRPPLLAFDAIVTMATADGGPDGLHRRRSTDAQVERWLAAARAAGAYLLLDLQPGRSDFVTEARAYERFLREPDVGLALDPEWRTPPPDRPRGGHVGSVPAAELNALTSWLATIVREERLPQKVVVVHHFTEDMVTDDARIAEAPGVALVFQADGYGERASKVAAYRRLVQPGHANGIMVFLDEDVDPLGPEELLGLEPPPDIISYQ